ncbi:MAG: hypothetical protein ACFB2W_00470 [Leptolyngbyaceae cyanobacterium]
MAETTTKTRAAKTEELPFSGKRVITWNPERDPRQPEAAPLRGYEMVRQYAFTMLDTKRTEASKSTAKATLANDKLIQLGDNIPYTPFFKNLILTPGLNWIDAAEWETFLAESKARLEKDLEQNSQAVDEIQSLIENRAILVFKPGERVQKTRQFTGNLEDYGASELTRLVSQIDDVGALQRYAQDTRDYALQQIISERIDTLNTGY